MTNAEYILEFINSDTVYKHLIDINYEPDSLTAAFIVWQGECPLAEKEKAFEWIIKNMPDMPIPTNEYHAEKESLHKFLREYMSTLSDYIALFQMDAKNAVYDFSARYDESELTWVDDDNLYSSYEKVFDAALHSFPENYDDYPDAPRPFLFKVRRRIIDTEAGSDYLYLTPDLEPYKFLGNTTVSDKDYEILHFWRNLRLQIPHPRRYIAKRGDDACS